MSTIDVESLRAAFEATRAEIDPDHNLPWWPQSEHVFGPVVRHLAESRPSAGLDVERLARALNATVGTNGWLRSTPSDPVEEWRVNARLIAAEYDRLAEAER